MAVRDERDLVPPARLAPARPVPASAPTATNSLPERAEQPRPVRPLGIRLVLHEIVVVASGFFGYFGVRGLTEGNVATAMANADTVVRAERWLGIYVEPSLQAVIVDHDIFTAVMNWVYIYGHWPVIFATLAWLLVTQRDHYYLLRNAMIISGLVGLVIFVLFPLAPPRLADLGLVDTVTEQSRGYRVLQPPAFVNQYAAMPSLHFGWDLIVGIILFRTVRGRLLKAIAVLMPIAMFAAVVLTANHYIVDPLIGGALALAGLAAAVWWQSRHPAVVYSVSVPRPRTA